MRGMADDERIREERRLADELRHAPEDRRAALYAHAYDRIYSLYLEQAGDAIEEQTFGATRDQIALLGTLAPDGAAVLEVGCGTGLLAIELQKLNRKVVGVDVSNVALDRARHYAAGTGAEFLKINGTALPFPDANFDFAFSVEVLEHLHESDALPHLREVARVLRPGALYLVATPNGAYAHGRDMPGHLREWRIGELRALARRAGFARVRTLQNRERQTFLPASVGNLLERVVRNPRAAARFGLTNITAVLQRR